MALLFDPFDALRDLQRSHDPFRDRSWLGASPGGGGSYPPLNGFRTGEDFAIIAESPGIRTSDREIQVKGKTIRIAGSKSATCPERASFHRRERLHGHFDRAVTLPVEVAADRMQAECRAGTPALFLPRAESDKPRSIKMS
jgi:HSP20 family protein